MGALTLIHGPAHPGKWTPTYERCLERLNDGRSESFLWLFPSPFQAQLMHRRLLSDGNLTLYTGQLALDFDRFLASIYRLCAAPRPSLPTSAHRLLVEDALAANTDVTPYYSRRPEGLGRGLTRLFRTLEETGILPDDLEGGHHRRAELRILYATYLERLRGTWIGNAEASSTADENIDHKKIEQLFPSLDLLIICGFSTLAAPYLSVLKKTIDIVPESIALIDYDQNHPQIFSPTTPFYEFLNSHAKHSESRPFSPVQYPAADLAPRLFTENRIQVTAPVEQIPCSDRLGEIKEIARRIRQMHQSQGVDLAQVRIGFRHLDHYAPLIAEVLPRYGLPFYLSRGWPLASAPVVNAVLAIIDLVLEGYSRPALVRLLSLPWIRLNHMLDGQAVALSAADFDAWARNLPPTTGRQDWLDALDRRCEYLERELDLLTDPVSDEIDNPQTWREDLREDLETLRPVQSGLSILFKVLQPLEYRQDLPSFRRHLLHALAQLGLEQQIKAELATTGSMKDGRALSQLLQVLDELCAPAAAQTPRTLSDFSTLFRDAISQARIPADTHAGIQVTDLTSAGSAPCDYLYLGGLVQGEFPHQSPADIFLDETLRQSLGLDDEREADTERLLFYQALCTPRCGLCILYPRRSGTTILSPSPFARELDNLLNPLPATTSDHSQPFTTADLHSYLGCGLSAIDVPDQAKEALDLYHHSTSIETYRLGLRRLLHGLHICEMRLHPKSLSPYEGVLDGEELLAGLHDRLGPSHAFSTTQIETYGRCPFRFFAQRLLGIKSLQDPEADESALERGNLIHRILYSFYSANGDAVENPENLAQARLELRRLGREKAADMKLEGFFWDRELERLLGTEDNQDREGILPRFLQLQAETANPATATHFELSFGSYPGMGPSDAQSTSTPFVLLDTQHGDEVRLFGKVDRIDRTDDGHFIVLDYKTGLEPRIGEIEQGLNLQLPLYILAIEALFKEIGLKEGAGGAYLLLRDLEHCGRRGLFADATQRNSAYSTNRKEGLYEHRVFRQLLDTVRDFVFNYARNIRRGIFHVTRHKPASICPGCPYTQSCRLNPQRMRTMDRIEALP